MIEFLIGFTTDVAWLDRTADAGVIWLLLVLVVLPLLTLIDRGDHAHGGFSAEIKQRLTTTSEGKIRPFGPNSRRSSAR